jgi:hypothetical protein
MSASGQRADSGRRGVETKHLRLGVGAPRDGDLPVEDRVLPLVDHQDNQPPRALGVGRGEDRGLVEIAGRGGDGRVAERASRAVVVAVELESRLDVARQVVVSGAVVPVVGQGDPLSPEHAERVGLREAARDVVAGAEVVLGHGQLGAGVAGGDLLLQPGDEADQPAAQVGGDPALFDIARVPQTARRLQARLDGLGADVLFGDSFGAARLGVPVDVERVNQPLVAQLEPGRFEVMVGGSCDKVKKVNLDVAAR